MQSKNILSVNDFFKPINRIPQPHNLQRIARPKTPPKPSIV